MERVRRKPKKSLSMTQILRGVICLLVVILVIVVIVAVSLHGQTPDIPEDTQGTQQTTENTEPSETQPPIELTVTSPETPELSTNESSVELKGTSDPAQPVTVNGQKVTQNADGSFAHTVELQPGENVITVAHKDQTAVYTVDYRYHIESFLPEKRVEYGSGATLYFAVSIREGSELSVRFHGKDIEMEKHVNQLGTGISEGFVLYVGSYKLPANDGADLDMGKVEYTVTCDGVTEVHHSGSIICTQAPQVLASNPSVTPDYGEYIDVGSGYIVEIINYSAETFNGATNDDKSSPERNYLPMGTVDYASTKVVEKGNLKYILMRCGRRVYIEKNNYPSFDDVPVIDCYKGTLPDHNEIGFASLTEEGHFTILTLDSMWKAPFYFDLKPQKYINPDIRDYRVNSVTAEYVDITFCYATVFEGTVTVPADNPLFSHAELTQNESDCTLRLYLKKAGGFYGWDAYYNDDDQLCFKFLNPVKATAGDNAYGADLTGITILVDVGHGGIDGGAVAKDANGKDYRDENGKLVEEADRNLALALVLRRELESMGATVIMTREDDSPVHIDERLLFMKEVAPDLCISVHHNSIAGYPNHSGAEIRYFHSFSQPIALQMYYETKETEVYKKTTLDWHVFFVARQTNCPVVLMENGYLTNEYDRINTLAPAAIAAKAQAMAQATANYFLNIG